jgi:hypothetical protein
VNADFLSGKVINGYESKRLEKLSRRVPEKVNEYFQSPLFASLKKDEQSRQGPLDSHKEAMPTAPIILIADRNDDTLKYLQKELATTDYTSVTR